MSEFEGSSTTFMGVSVGQDKVLNEHLIFLENRMVLQCGNHINSIAGATSF